MAPRPVLRRRPLLAGLLAFGLGPARAETQRFRIALANLDETPGVTLDGLESGKKRRERGLAKSGNARVRRGMLQLAWCFLMHQKHGPLAEWYRARTADARRGTRKTMIVALARKLLIVLWRLATTGEAPHGLAIRPAT